MKKCPYCAEEIMDDAAKCKHCGEWLKDRGNPSHYPQSSGQNSFPSGADRSRLKKELNGISLAWGVPGLIIQHVGYFINPIIALIGTLLVIMGLGYYAKSKGYSAVWGIVGAVPFLIGVIILGLLPDHYKEQKV